MLLITSIVMTSCKCRTWAPLFCRMSNHYSLNAYQLGYNLLVFCFYASAHPVDGAGGKAVTRGVFWVFEHPPKFHGKIRHTKTI